MKAGSAHRPAGEARSLVGNAVALGTVCMVVAGVVVVAGNNLPDPDFWWDESGQFWMSQGQNHGSSFGTPTGSLTAGLDFGRNGYNLDPIGFTALLRYWIGLFGSSPGALRALPFAFFVLAFLAAAWFARKTYRIPWPLVLLAPAIALSTYIPLQYSTELRPYSLELLGVIVVAGLTAEYVARSRSSTLVLLIGSLVLFSVFSRYSFITSVLSSVGTLGILTLIARRDLMRGFLAVAASAAAIAMFVAWNIGLLGGSGLQESPGYTDELDLQDSWDWDFLATTLRANFLDTSQVLNGLSLLLGALAVLVVMILRKRKARIAEDGHIRRMPRCIDSATAHPWSRNALTATLAFIALYEIAAIALSSLGLSPWNASARWSIGLHGLAVVSGLLLISVAVRFAKWLGLCPLDGARSRPFVTKILVASLVAVVLLVDVVMVYRSMMRISYFRHTSYQPLATSLASLESQLKGSGTQVTHWLAPGGYWPQIRMLWETDASMGLGIARPESASTYNGSISLTELMPRLQELGIKCDSGTSVAVLLQVDQESLPSVGQEINSSTASVPSCSIVYATTEGPWSLLILR